MKTNTLFLFLVTFFSLHAFADRETVVYQAATDSFTVCGDNANTNSPVGT